MRPSVYPEKLVFHECQGVAAELKAKAEREGITFSELLRRAARREVREAA